MAQESPRLIEEPLGEYVEPFRGALLSPDGQLIAQVIGEELRVYDGVTALSQRRPLFTTEHVHTDSLQSNMAAVSFSADGKLIAFPSRRGVEILDTRSGKAHASVELSKIDNVDALAFSPDGRQLAVSFGFLYHKHLHVFDTATGKLLGKPITDVDGRAYQVLFSPDGKYLVANHWRTIYLIDAASQRLETKVATKASAVVFRNDKLHCVLAESGAIHAVTSEGIEKTPFGPPMGKFDDSSSLSTVWRMAFSRQPVRVAIPQGEEVIVRTVEGRTLFRVIREGVSSPAERVSLSADGRVLLILRQTGRIEAFRLE
jgi:WD40 repeat protein